MAVSKIATFPFSFYPFSYLISDKLTFIYIKCLVITPSWLSWSWKSFLYSSSVYCCHLFLISSTSVRCIPLLSFLYCAHLCMKCSLGISNFLDEISSLSHSIAFLYFFAPITDEGFLISPCYSLELYIQMGMSFFFFVAFSVSFFLSCL